MNDLSQKLLLRFRLGNDCFQDIFHVQNPTVQRQVWQKPVVQHELILGSTDFRSEWQLLGRPDVQRPLSVGRESPEGGHSRNKKPRLSGRGRTSGSALIGGGVTHRTVTLSATIRWA